MTFDVDNFGFAAKTVTGVPDRGYTDLGNIRRHHEEVAELTPKARFLNDAGSRSTGLAFVPPRDLPGGSGWDAPESTHGVVDGLTAVPRDWREAE